MDYRLIFAPGRERGKEFKKAVADLEFEVGTAVPLAEVLRQCMDLFTEKGSVYAQVRERIEGGDNGSDSGE